MQTLIEILVSMATANVLPLLPLQDPLGAVDTIVRKRKQSDSKMPSSIWDLAGEAPARMAFDAKQHVDYKDPSKIWMMKEIGLEHAGISPVAVSEPFPLFTPQAIQQMRAEILSKPVVKNCQYSSNLAHCQLRGFAPE